MCLECGYYNGRQVMDLATEKAKRDARIKAKEEKIRNELNQSEDSAPKAPDTGEQAPADIKDENIPATQEAEADAIKAQATKENTPKQK